MSSLIVSKKDILKEIKIEDVQILTWTIPNSILLKKRLYGVANKDVEINTVYMNFNFRGAPYCFYAHNYVLQRFACLDTGLMMGYVKHTKVERTLNDTYIRDIKADPFTGDRYIPLKNVKKVPLWPHTFEQSHFKYKENQSNCFKDLDFGQNAVKSEYLDEEFFFSLLESKSFDISEVRWYK